ncbi:MAG TPA: ABC transporter permease, partial [Burkholderiales bacterium]|nr:ABC transporter permease [Burkholderiales bacterium]
MMKFEITVALRFLREGRMQTALIVGGTTIGVSLIIFITGMLTGLQADLVRRTLGTQPQVVVRPPDEINRVQLVGTSDVAPMVNAQARAQRLRSIDQWQPLLARIAAMPDVIAVAPTVSGAALARRGEADKAITLYGIEREPYLRVTKLDEKIVAGQLSVNTGEIVIGIQLAQDLGVGVGDKIRIETARSLGDAFTVRGLIDAGNREANRRNVYVNFRTGQTLLDLIGGASNLDISTNDVFAAEKFAQALRNQTDQKVESWIETNSQLFTAIANQNVMTFLIRAFVAVIVAVGITSVLVVSVVQKQREIGILRAMGAARGAILRVFLLQGAIIGVASATLGSVGGTGLIVLGSRLLRSPDGSAFLTVRWAPEL